MLNVLIVTRKQVERLKSMKSLALEDSKGICMFSRIAKSAEKQSKKTGKEKG